MCHVDSFQNCHAFGVEVGRHTLLFLNSRQPSPHVWLMLSMEVGKEFTGIEGLTLQPRKVALWLYQHFIG
jgi:hypothetical protein